jgi:hypothetical protein
MDPERLAVSSHLKKVCRASSGSFVLEYKLILQKFL